MNRAMGNSVMSDLGQYLVDLLASMQTIIIFRTDEDYILSGTTAAGCRFTVVREGLPEVLLAALGKEPPRERTRCCCTCERDLPIVAYGTRRDRPGSLAYRCKECEKQRVQKYRNQASQI